MYKLKAWLTDFTNAIVDRFTWALEWFEGAFHIAFEKLLHPRRRFGRKGAAEGINEADEATHIAADSFEFFFERIVAVVIWLLTPWRWFQRKKSDAPESFAGAEIFESYFHGFLVKLAAKCNPWRTKIITDLGPDDVAVAEEPENPIAVRMRHYAHCVLYSFDQAFGFLGAWWYSRDSRKLLWAIPAVIMAIPLAVSLVLTPLYSTDKKIKHYRLALASATERNDRAAEELCLEKLNQLGYERLDNAQFQTALELARNDQLEEAYEIMKMISPRKEPGFLRGHLWIAGTVLEGSITEDRPWDTIEIHTQHASQLNPNDPFVKRMQGELHLHRGHIVQAGELFEEVVGLFPNYHATLMRIYRERGDVIAAKRHARRAIEFLSDRAGRFSSENQITAIGYLLWAESHNLLNNPDAEFQVLAQGLSQYPADTALQLAFDRAADSRLAKVTPQSPAGPAVLEEILKVNPRAQQAWLVLLRGVSAEKEEALQLVNELHSKGLLTADFHKQVGDVYFTKSDYGTARQYYELACEMQPDSAFALNNLGWILGNVEPVNLQEAVAKLNRAITCRPDPRFYETRGQILIKLQRWTEAIHDLQRAINGKIPNEQDAHRSLATAYDRLGNTEQAAAHRSMTNRSGS